MRAGGFKHELHEVKEKRNKNYLENSTRQIYHTYEAIVYNIQLFTNVNNKARATVSQNYETEIINLFQIYMYRQSRS